MAKDPRTGWYKIFIPELQEVLCGLFIDPNIYNSFDPFPFIYGRIDTDQVAFDTSLDVSLYAIDAVILLGKEPGDDGMTEVPMGPDVPQGQEAFALKVQLRPLSMFAEDNTNRCYIPTEYVSCILPVDDSHPIINVLVNMTTKSGLIIPPIGSQGNGPRVLDLDGNALDVPKV